MNKTVRQNKKAALENSENAELFRCITESHPLPVWVVDEESGEIIYESLPASEMLGRKWDPETPQFIAEHYVDLKDRTALRKKLDGKDRLTDHEIKIKQINGTEIWISANVRRANYEGRDVLISGVTDITERKEREDLFGFMIKNHPLPVWMSDSATGDVIYQSDATARLFGWDDPDFKSPAHLRAHFANDDDYKALSKKLAIEDEINDYETILKRADGTEFSAAGNIRRTEYQGRDVVLSGIADISAQKQRDAEIRFVVESHPLPVWMNDIETGDIIFESEASARMFGRTHNSGKKINVNSAYCDPEDRKSFIKKLKKEGAIEGYEIAWRRENGEQFWARGNAKLMHFEGRDVIVAGIMDVTDQKRRESEQIRARQLLNDAIESLSEGFALYDEDNCLVFCNSRYREMNAVVADILEPGLTWEKLMQVSARRGEYVDAIGREEEWVAERLEAGIEFIQNFELQHSDGQWFSVSVHPTELGGFVVTRVEITERKRIEEAQKQADALVHQVLDACPIPIQMSAMDDDEIFYRSPACLDLYGEIKSSGSIFADPVELQGFVKALHENGAVNDMQVQLVGADKAPYWASISARVIEFRDKKVVVSSSLDLTERMAAEEEVKRSGDLLTDAIESLSEGFALYDSTQKLVMCNQRYKEMNGPTQDILKPGMKLTDYLKTGVERGQFMDAIGRENEWLKARKSGYKTSNTGFEFAQSDGRSYSASNTMTREGGFVVTRVDITDRKKAEAARQEANAVVREVVTACPVALEMQYLPDGKFIFRSPEAIELLGECDDPAQNFVYPDDHAQLLRLIERDGEVMDCRVHLRHVDGTKFWASVSARTTEFRGKLVAVSTVYDLTEREELEAEHTRAGERLNDAIESLSEGFALYGADDRLVMCNKRYREMHHACADALKPGVNWFDFLRITAERQQFHVPENDIEAWLEERAKDRSEYRKSEFQHTDGRWYIVSTSPTREGGFVVTRSDISDRKKMEETQREADAVVRQVLEACPVMIMMNHVESGDVIYGTPATESLFGKFNSVRNFYANPEDRDRYLKKMLKDGIVEDFEYDAKRPNGEVFRAAVSGRLIEYQGDQVIVSHTYDLTDRNAMLDELSRQREILHQSEKLSALGELLAGIAHELNNPLSVVVGQSLLLKETTTDPLSMKRAEKIGNAADRCARIVKTFLAMARQQPAQTTNVDINEVIESSLELANYALRSADVDLTLNLAANLPTVWGDGDQLGQVMINLIINAEQALEDWEGRRKIKIVSRHDKRKEEIVIKVADSGPGIPASIRSRVFEPFFTTKEVGTGTGIGLAFCHRIVETHGGSIRAAVNPGGGSIFFVRLPLSQQDNDADSPQNEENQTGNRLAVLVIDDESDVSDFIAEVLRNDGHEVTVASSGAEALQHLAQRSFSVILSDLKMPNLDGPSLFEKMKVQHAGLIAHLGFISGDTMSPKARDFLSGSQRPYLDKPIRPAELRELVAGLAESSSP